ncbi:MAG: serine--tRNA ligase [Armatimonadota bacterium]
MLDLRLIRAEPDLIRNAVRKRGMELDVDRILELDERHRDALYHMEQRRATLNATSKQISELKKSGQDAQEKIQAMRGLREEIKGLEETIRATSQQLNALLLEVPNLPREEVPVGLTEEENLVVREGGEVRKPDFEVLPHWEIGRRLGILAFESAVRIAGERFVSNMGPGAALERALVNFMLDVHTTEHGYLEVWPPYLARADALIGTANLPKFEDVLFKTTAGHYLIPTAEVPLTNMHMGEILEAQDLPKHYTAYTACFRNEQVGAGKEARGLIRLYQFHKVELMKFTTPETADQELEALVSDAETIVQRLGLPYRVSLLCTGDITFASCKTYDIEVYFPGMDCWLELSSCSMYDTFQARRCNTRYRPEPKAKPEFVHTMNGSGLATGRTLAALLEHYQQADGTISVPEVLRPYMRGMSVIGA